MSSQTTEVDGILPPARSGTTRRQVPGRRGLDSTSVDVVGTGSALRVGERELAAQLGRQAKLDAFVDWRYGSISVTLAA
jgi:hypothetical protein